MHVVNFIAPWSEDPKADSEIFKSVQDKYRDTDVVFSEVNASDPDQEDYAQRHHVSVYPTVLVVINKGVVADRLEGRYTADNLNELIQRNLVNNAEIR